MKYIKLPVLSIFIAAAFSEAATLNGTLTETPNLKGLPSDTPLAHFGISRTSAVLFGKKQIAVYDETGFPYWADVFKAVEQTTGAAVSLSVTTDKSKADIIFRKNDPTSALSFNPEPLSVCALNSYKVDNGKISLSTVEISVSNPLCANSNNAHGFSFYLAQIFRSLGFAGRISDNPNALLAVQPAKDNAQYDITVPAAFVRHMYGTYKAKDSIHDGDEMKASKDELLVLNVPHIGKTVNIEEASPPKEAERGFLDRLLKGKKDNALAIPPSRLETRPVFDEAPTKAGAPVEMPKEPETPVREPVKEYMTALPGVPKDNPLLMDLPPFPDMPPPPRMASGIDRPATPAYHATSTFDRQQEEIRRRIDLTPVKYYSYNPNDVQTVEQIYADFGIKKPTTAKTQPKKPTTTIPMPVVEPKKQEPLTTPPKQEIYVSDEKADTEIISQGTRKKGRLLFEDTLMKKAEPMPYRAPVQPPRLFSAAAPSPKEEPKRTPPARPVVKTGTQSDKPKEPSWLEMRKW